MTNIHDKHGDVEHPGHTELAEEETCGEESPNLELEDGSIHIEDEVEGRDETELEGGGFKDGDAHEDFGDETETGPPGFE